MRQPQDLKDPTPRQRAALNRELLFHGAVCVGAVVLVALIVGVLVHRWVHAGAPLLSFQAGLIVLLLMGAGLLIHQTNELLHSTIASHTARWEHPRDEIR